MAHSTLHCLLVQLNQADYSNDYTVQYIDAKLRGPKLNKKFLIEMAENRDRERDVNQIYRQFQLCIMDVTGTRWDNYGRVLNLVPVDAIRMSLAQLLFILHNFPQSIETLYLQNPAQVFTALHSHLFTPEGSKYLVLDLHLGSSPSESTQPYFHLNSLQLNLLSTRLSLFPNLQRVTINMVNVPLQVNSDMEEEADDDPAQTPPPELVYKQHQCIPAVCRSYTLVRPFQLLLAATLRRPDAPPVVVSIPQQHYGCCRKLVCGLIGQEEVVAIRKMQQNNLYRVMHREFRQLGDIARDHILNLAVSLTAKVEVLSAQQACARHGRVSISNYMLAGAVYMSEQQVPELLQGLLACSCSLLVFMRQAIAGAQLGHAHVVSMNAFAGRAYAPYLNIKVGGEVLCVGLVGCEIGRKLCKLVDQKVAVMEGEERRRREDEERQRQEALELAILTNNANDLYVAALHAMQSMLE